MPTGGALDVVAARFAHIKHMLAASDGGVVHRHIPQEHRFDVRTALDSQMHGAPLRDLDNTRALRFVERAEELNLAQDRVLPRKAVSVMCNFHTNAFQRPFLAIRVEPHRHQ